MGDPRHTDKFRRVVDDVDHPPIAHADAPLIFVALEFFHPAGGGVWPRDSIIERENLNVRMRLRRFTWLARRFSREPLGGWGTLLDVVQFLPGSRHAANDACSGRRDRRPDLDSSGSSQGSMKHFAPPLFYIEGLV
jgi:hypothetical protein